MQEHPPGNGSPEARPSLAALWQEATDIVREAIAEAEAAIDFIGTTLESLRPLLDRVHALQAQIQEAPGAARRPPPAPAAAPEAGGEAAPQPPAREAVARYTLTLETGETRSDFPHLYHRLDEALGDAETALISYLGGVAVLTVEGPDLTPDAVERAVRQGLGADVELEWEDEQHIRVRLD